MTSGPREGRSSSDPMTLASKKIEAQARACVAALSIVLRRTLVERYPADRALAAFLRENPQFGARDRRLIGRSVFGALRWWGWLQWLRPGHLPLDSDDSDSAGWARVLIGAHLLETGTLPPVAPCGHGRPRSIRRFRTREPPAMIRR